MFSTRRRGTKRRNYRFLLVVGVRNAVFTVFYPSEGSESLFFVFSAHPRPRKVCFSCFLLIRDLGKVVFGDFYSSEASESLFFAFSAHPRPRKGIHPAKNTLFGDQEIDHLLLHSYGILALRRIEEPPIHSYQRLLCTQHLHFLRAIRMHTLVI